MHDIRIVERTWNSGNIDYAVEKFIDGNWKIMTWEDSHDYCTISKTAEFKYLYQAKDFYNEQTLANDRIKKIVVIND